jgi:hypothetical protein
MTWCDLPFPTTPQVWLPVRDHGLVRIDQVVRWSARPAPHGGFALVIQVHGDTAGPDGPREHVVIVMETADDANVVALEILEVFSRALSGHKSGVVVLDDSGEYQLESFRALAKADKIDRF